MGLTYRKSISAGPFRFNLSGAGIGVYVGVPGFRVGASPRGNYISMSAGGFRYRHALSQERKPDARVRPAISEPVVSEDDPPPHLTHISSGSDTVSPLELIRSADIEKLSDSSADELLTEINRKRAMVTIWPWPLLIAACFIFVQLNKGVEPFVQYLLIGGLGLLAIVTTWLYLWDDARRAVVLFYDLDKPAQDTFEKFIAAFGQLQSCQKAWRIQAQGQVLSRKHNAGAGLSIKREPAALWIGNLKTIRCNIDVPCLKAGPTRFYFYPDKILIENSGRIA